MPYQPWLMVFTLIHELFTFQEVEMKNMNRLSAWWCTIPFTYKHDKTSMQHKSTFLEKENICQKISGSEYVISINQLFWTFNIVMISVRLTVTSWCIVTCWAWGIPRCLTVLAQGHQPSQETGFTETIHSHLFSLEGCCEMTLNSGHYQPL